MVEPGEKQVFIDEGSMTSYEDRQRAIAAQSARRAEATGKVQAFIDEHDGHADDKAIRFLLHSLPVDDT